MIRSHKIRLKPNNKQITYFSKACGISRLAYNWGLNEWKKQYESGEKPSAYGLKKQFNSIKKEEFPFITEVTKCACDNPFSNLSKAFSNFFRNVKQGKKPGYPKFKKKGLHDSFYIQNDMIQIKNKNNKIRIPKLGWVKLAEELRFKGKIMSAVISKTADKWFVSISVEMPDAIYDESQVIKAVGIDLGITKLAILSDGKVFKNPRVTKQFERRLRLLNKALSRKKKGSSNRHKAIFKLSNLHYKIASARSDSIHKMTSYVAKNYSDVCIEDLNVKGMVKNRKLSKAISDASFYEIRRQLEYKCQNVHLVDRFFPSTKLCPQCGIKNDMPLNKRIYECKCGYGPVDRDLHSARNILRQGLSDVKPVEMKALA